MSATGLQSQTEAQSHAPDEDPVYTFKPRLGGPAWTLTLRRNGLFWSYGHRSGLIPYDRIDRVRLSFRPLTFQWYRFITEISSPDAPRIQIASTSWRNMLSQERLDASYTAFVTELHRRMAAIGSRARFRCGVPAPAFAVAIVMAAAVAVAVIGLLASALQFGEWRALAVIAALVAVFVWQLGTFMMRNRPGSYRPDALPPQLLPRG